MQPTTKTYRSGSYLFHENDHSRELYVVQSGRVRVFRKMGAREIPLAFLGKGAVLGEMSLIDGKPRSASVQAVEDCSVVLIDSDTFHSKTRGVPPWFVSIIRMTSQKIRKANDRLQQATGSSFGANIILTLQYFFARDGGSGKDDPRLSLPHSETRKRLIQVLGVTSHRVCGALEYLAQHGLIEITEERLFLQSISGMEEYCRFLRLLLRKALDKVQPLAPELEQLVLAVAEGIPETVSPRGKKVTVTGDDFWPLLQKSALTGKAHQVIEDLKEYKLLTTQKESSGSGNPLSGSKFTVNCQSWMRYFLSTKYKGMVPSL